MNYVHKRRKCGISGLKFSGYKVVIRLLNFFMVSQPNKSEGTL